MKNLLLILVLFISVIAKSQEPKISIQSKDSIISYTEFEYVDTLFFEIVEENNFYYSNWHDSVSNDTIIKTQFRISAEGIREKRVYEFLSTTDTTITYDYYSFEKSKKDKKLKKIK